MKKIFKLFVMILVVSIMLFNVIGCGGGKREQSDPVDRDKELSLSLFHFSFTGFANEYKASNISKILMNKLKISNFDVYTAPYSDWKTSFGLLAATDELPDFFKFDGPSNPEQYTTWVDSNMLLNVDDFVTEDKYPNLYKHLNSYKHLNLNLLASDKKLHAIPCKSPQPNHVMVIRGNWVDNLNKKREEIANIKYIDGSDYVLGDEEYKYPETISDFYRLAVAMTYADPDGNGKKDTFGYTSSDASMWYNHWIFNMFGSSYQDYMINPETGKYESTWITDGSKKAVKFIKKMRDEGIIEPNFFANGPIDGMTQFYQGKIGMTLINGEWFNGEYAKMKDSFRDEIAAGKVDPNRIMDMVVPLPAGDGRFGSIEGARGFRGNSGYGWCVGINNNISDNKKDRIMMLLDYLLSDEGTRLTLYGVEGEHYKVDEKGNIVNLIPNDENTGMPRTLRSFDYAWEIRMMIDESNQYFMPWENNYDKLRKMAEYCNGPEGGIAYLPVGVAGETAIQYGQALNDMALEWYARIIHGQNLDGGNMTDFDATWEDFVGRYLDNKGREIMNEMNEIIESRK